MSKASVYIKEFEIANYKCFQGRHTFTLVDEKDNWCQWNVFLGNNNTGKTNLLKVMATKLSQNFIYKNNHIHISDYENKYIEKDKNSSFYRSFHIISNNLGNDKKEDSFFYLWESLFLCGYGVIRDIETVGISETKQLSYSQNLLFNSKLINFEDWLFQLDYAVKNGKEKVAARRDLLIEVLKSDIFPEIHDIRFVSDEKANNHIDYQTKDGWYILSELGYGYQSMLSWLMDFAKKMFDRYPDSENPLKEPAVLLVDEIDLHLHPAWQRKIIKYLSDLFPKTQFIVTTHSPFILQSMENVNLYTLRREGDHTISTHLGNQSFVGWRIEEILREIMDLGDDINTDYYQNLSDKFDKALDDNDYKAAKEAYEELSKILHPTSSKRKLMEIQISQIISPND